MEVVHARKSVFSNRNNFEHRQHRKESFGNFLAFFLFFLFKFYLQSSDQYNECGSGPTGLYLTISNIPVCGSPFLLSFQLHFLQDLVQAGHLPLHHHLGRVGRFKTAVPALPRHAVCFKAAVPALPRHVGRFKAAAPRHVGRTQLHGGGATPLHAGGRRFVEQAVVGLFNRRNDAGSCKRAAARCTQLHRNNCPRVQTCILEWDSSAINIFIL